MSGENGQELPQGWAKTTLDGIVQPRVDKIDPQARPRAKFIGMQHIEAHTMRLLGTVSADSMKSTSNAFRSGDVLYGRLRPYLNKVCRSDFEGLCSGELIVIPESCAMHGKFLGYRLNSGDFVRFSSGLNTGDRPRVDFDQIKVFPIHLPPIREQIRIGNTLDELFSDLDIGVAALERVRDKLKLYRASVLKAAVEGALTAEWRQQNPQTEPAGKLLKRILVARRRRWEEDQLRKFEEKGKSPPKNWEAKYKEPVSPDAADLPTLPEGWCWASLDQLGRLDRGRSKHRPRNAKFLYGGPYPFIQTGDVKGARQYLRNHSQTYSNAGLRQSRLWPEETLCITIAANIADTAILSYPACFPDSIVGVCFDESSVSVRYVELFIRTVRAQIDNYAPATAQKNINNAILRALAVALPPIDEQKKIVEIAENQLSTIDHLESELRAKTKTAQGLRQAILHRAFTGKLVPQDPNDEPASELLKRIVAERAEGTVAVKRSGQKGNNGADRRRWSRGKKKETAA